MTANASTSATATVRVSETARRTRSQNVSSRDSPVRRQSNSEGRIEARRTNLEPKQPAASAPQPPQSAGIACHAGLPRRRSCEEPSEAEHLQNDFVKRLIGIRPHVADRNARRTVRVLPA